MTLRSPGLRALNAESLLAGMRSLRLLAALILYAAAAACSRRAAAPSPPSPGPAAEIRAVWVDGFHAGIRNQEEINQLVADAKKANLNTLIVQVRRRGDAYYTKTIEPPVEDAAYDPQFDALQAVLDAGHREGLEVHAWINAMPVWRNEPPPKDPRHVFNLHGLSKSGEENWLTRDTKGEMKFPVGYFLDPGHPAAAEHLVGVYVNIVRNYPVDGIHFDYIRYPETEERMPRGAPVGYNETNLARFLRASGRRDQPAPEDEQWMAWRRQQVTQLVRRIYIEAKAVNPRIKVSAATIAWGKPPSGEKDFLDSAAGQRIYQDWHSWLKEGILDIAFPMNYARESDATVRDWFNGWIAWEKQHKHGRRLAVGIGAYRNPKESNLAQVERVRQPAGAGRADGMSFFSYANMAAAAQPAERASYLSEGVEGRPGPFAQPVPVPKLDWIERPVTGWVAGTATGPHGEVIDGGRVRLRKTGWWPFRRSMRTTSDGGGWFGFAGVSPGRYELRLEGGPKALVEVTPGRVSRADLKR